MTHPGSTDARRTRRAPFRKGWTIVPILALCLASGGCAVRGFAVNQVGNALAASGAGFGADDDPELVGAAAPFSLKLMESVLAETPDHGPLLLAATRGFVQYAYAFIELKADELEDANLKEAYAQRERAQRMYLRARDYGLRGLDAAYPGMRRSLRADPTQALVKTSRVDAGLLYWTGVAWAAAISLAKDDPHLVADLPAVEALVRRALALDDALEHGGVHTFLINFEMSRAGVVADAPARARRHFERALELTGGLHAAPYVTLAEAVCVAERNRAQFEHLLQQALRLDPGARPEWRLVNLVMQRRARWLLARTEKLFAD